MTDSPWLAALITLFLWWFSTGIILWRVRVADNGTAQDHVNSVVIGLPLLAIGIGATWASLPDLSAKGIYMAFLASPASSPARTAAPARPSPTRRNGSGAPWAPSPGTRRCWSPP
jgi:hypothetical protein